jgi:hypothetical protein
MRFRFVYQGELRSNQRDPLGNQSNKLAKHKQAIRKALHRKLKYFWETSWFLGRQEVYPKDYGIGSSAPDKLIPLIDAVAHSHQENGYRFVPLVRKDWRLACSLHVIFLRHDPPGSIVHAGDLDNRIKTLIDALRKPQNAKELSGNERPETDEDPFFCLLEDDKLITGLSVESDQLLIPPKSNKSEDIRKVHIIVTVYIRPYGVTLFNLSFS